jgi:hypothetical protein
MNHGDFAAFKIWPPVFRMYAEHFEKMGLSPQQMKAIVYLQLDHMVRIAKLDVELGDKLKEIFKPEN